MENLVYELYEIYASTLSQIIFDSEVAGDATRSPPMSQPFGLSWGFHRMQTADIEICVQDSGAFHDNA